jgi:hypothetical protein
MISFASRTSTAGRRVAAAPLGSNPDRTVPMRLAGVPPAAISRIDRANAGVRHGRRACSLFLDFSALCHLTEHLNLHAGAWTLENCRSRLSRATDQQRRTNEAFAALPPVVPAPVTPEKTSELRLTGPFRVQDDFSTRHCGSRAWTAGLRISRWAFEIEIASTTIRC